MDQLHGSCRPCGSDQELDTARLPQGPGRGADIQTLVVFFLPGKSRYFAEKLFSCIIPDDEKIIISRTKTLVQHHCLLCGKKPVSGI